MKSGWKLNTNWQNKAANFSNVKMGTVTLPVNSNENNSTDHIIITRTAHPN